MSASPASPPSAREVGIDDNQIFDSPVFANAQFEPGYVEGHDAGGITLERDAYVLDGSFYGGSNRGRQAADARQFAHPLKTANTNKANPSALPSAGYLRRQRQEQSDHRGGDQPAFRQFRSRRCLPEDRVANTALGVHLVRGGFGGSRPISAAN